MFCKRCGKIISEDSVYCQYCGADQTIVSEQETCESSQKNNVLKSVATGAAKSVGKFAGDVLSEVGKELVGYGITETSKGVKKNGTKFIDRKLKKAGLKDKNLAEKLKDNFKKGKKSRKK